MSHPETVDLLRFYAKEVPGAGETAPVRSGIEEHLSTCTSCGEKAAFLKALAQNMKALAKEDLAPTTPCPDSWTFASYISREVDQATAERINVHIAFCERCFEAYLSLSDEPRVREIVLNDEEEELPDVSVRTLGNISIVRVREHLHGRDFPFLDQVIDEELTQGHKSILLDLSELADIPIGSVHFLSDILRRVERSGGEIKVMAAVGQHEELFRLTHADQVRDEAEAVRSFSGPDRIRAHSDL